MDHFIHQTLQRQGYATAKLCRTVASGVCGYAVRRDALRFNPVRDVSPLEADTKEARAMSLAEVSEWLDIVDGNDFARRKDLPDLVRFLLGTGVRVGEALGVCWQDVDLDRQVVHVRRTVVRVPGEGLIAKPPKTRSGVRVLRLPLWLVALLRERRDRLVLVEVGPIFPDSLGGFRDRNNVERDFRQVRRGTAYEWVVPHTYRKAVATLLDDTGLSARTIADQLGHSRVSMTQDRHMGRRAVNEAVASALEGLMGQRESGEKSPPATLSAG